MVAILNRRDNLIAQVAASQKSIPTPRGRQCSHLTQNAYWTQDLTISESYLTFEWLLDLNDTNTQVFEIVNFHKNRGFSIFQHKNNEMPREYVPNVHMDIRDLEIEQQNDPFNRFLTRAKKFFQKSQIVNLAKFHIYRNRLPPNKQVATYEIHWTLLVGTLSGTELSWVNLLLTRK